MSTPTATPSTAPPSPEEEEILAVYIGYRELEVEIYADPDIEEARERFPEYLAGRLMRSTPRGYGLLTQWDYARVGQPGWDPTVEEIRWDDEPRPTATIRDCFDATDWVWVDTTTGEPVESPWSNGFSGHQIAAERHAMMYEAVLYDDDGWLIEYGTFDRGQEC